MKFPGGTLIKGSDRHDCELPEVYDERIDVGDLFICGVCAMSYELETEPNNAMPPFPRRIRVWRRR